MYLPDELIEEVRSRNDILDVVSSYVKLTKKGSTYFGLCPFHNEKSPSFSVSPNKQMFYCFGCGAGGNVFNFLMKYENMTFQEAVKALADRAGVPMPEVEMSPEDRKRVDIKNTLIEINVEAARYYHHLLGTPVGEKATQYLLGRGLSKETINAFGLGYSSMKSDSLYRHLKNKGYKDDLLKQTGLFIYEERAVHDRFINRVMYPYLDANRKVIGFGGRVMGKGEPKYLNTPETPIFEKGRNLFGLYLARSTRKNNFIICEGYMDVIALHQAGFDQAVGSMGTALTERMVMLIKRYRKDVYVCYDSDGAGISAALKAIAMFRAAGIATKVINMRPHKDPDEFLKNEGAEAFQKRIDEAENSFLYEVRMTERDYDMQDPTSQTDFTRAVCAMLLRFEEEIERDYYINAVAEKYQISANGIREMMANLAAKGYTKPSEKKVLEPVRKKEKDDGISQSQRMVLTWIADDPRIYTKIKPYLIADDFTVPEYKTVAEMMFADIEAGQFNPAAILDRFSDEEMQNKVAQIFNTEILDESARLKERETALNEAVIAIRRNSLEEKINTASDVIVMQQLITEQANVGRINISLT